MIVEYVGIADRWAGPGVVHEVRAWWNVNEADKARVKRAAIRELRSECGAVDRAEVIGMHTSTYSTPQLNALVRIRVLTAEEVSRRTELRARRYTRCDGCDGDSPGWLVRMDADGSERALCFTCWDPIKSACKVLHWINRHGKLSV